MEEQCEAIRCLPYQNSHVAYNFHQAIQVMSSHFTYMIDVTTLVSNINLLLQSTHIINITNISTNSMCSSKYENKTIISIADKSIQVLMTKPSLKL